MINLFGIRTVILLSKFVPLITYVSLDKKQKCDVLSRGLGLTFEKNGLSLSVFQSKLFTYGLR